MSCVGGHPLFVAMLIVGSSGALAEEADLSTPIGLAPDLSLRDLVPAALLALPPHAMQVETAATARDQPFQATFTIAAPDYPNVEMTLLVSTRERVVERLSRVFAMAASGALPGGSAADAEALPGEECIGVVDQNMITCMIGSAGVQFTASDFMDGGSIDYAATKALFGSLPVEAYRKVFAQ